MLYLRSGHISFVEIWSLDNFYDHSLWLVQVGQLLLTGENMDRLGSLPRNIVDRLIARLDMTLIVLTGP